MGLVTQPSIRVLFSDVPVSFPRSSGWLKEFGLLVAMKLFQAHTILWRLQLGYWVKRCGLMAPRSITNTGNMLESTILWIECQCESFLLTGFSLLLIGTKEGRELAVCGVPVNPDSISLRAAKNVAPFY